MQKALRLSALIALIIFAALMAWFAKTKSQIFLMRVPQNYEDCKNLGGTILETDSEQCLFKGQRFTNPQSVANHDL